MNWPEAFVTAVAIVGVCSCIMAIVLRSAVAAPEAPQNSPVPQKDEREKMPGLRAPGEYRVAYTPVSRSRRRRRS